MTKTFKSGNGTNRDLDVSTYNGNIHLVIEQGIGSAGILLDREVAPAIAFAILEAAGIVHHDSEDTPYDPKQRTTSMGDVNIAAFHLAQHVARAERIALIQAEEAADRAALWQEVSDLYHSCFPDNPAYESAEKMPEHLRDGWVRVALKAREINGASDA